MMPLKKNALTTDVHPLDLSESNNTQVDSELDFSSPDFRRDPISWVENDPAFNIFKGYFSKPDELRIDIAYNQNKAYPIATKIYLYPGYTQKDLVLAIFFTQFFTITDYKNDGFYDNSQNDNRTLENPYIKIVDGKLVLATCFDKRNTQQDVHELMTGYIEYPDGVLGQGIIKPAEEYDSWMNLKKKYPFCKYIDLSKPEPLTFKSLCHYFFDFIELFKKDIQPFMEELLSHTKLKDKINKRGLFFNFFSIFYSLTMPKYNLDASANKNNQENEKNNSISKGNPLKNLSHFFKILSNKEKNPNNDHSLSLDENEVFSHKKSLMNKMESSFINKNIYPDLAENASFHEIYDEIYRFIFSNLIFSDRLELLHKNDEVFEIISTDNLFMPSVSMETLYAIFLKDFKKEKMDVHFEKFKVIYEELPDNLKKYALLQSLSLFLKNLLEREVIDLEKKLEHKKINISDIIQCLRKLARKILDSFLIIFEIQEKNFIYIKKKDMAYILNFLFKIYEKKGLFTDQLLSLLISSFYNRFNSLSNIIFLGDRDIFSFFEEEILNKINEDFLFQALHHCDLKIDKHNTVNFLENTEYFEKIQTLILRSFEKENRDNVNLFQGSSENSKENSNNNFLGQNGFNFYPGPREREKGADSPPGVIFFLNNKL